MLVEQLNDINLLITLKFDDLAAFYLTESDLSAKNDKSTLLIKEIISLAMIKKGVLAQNKILSVDVFPFDKGCFILVTIHDKKARKKYRIKNSEELILSYFNNVQNVLTVIYHLYRLSMPCKSTLYMSSTNKYFLLIKTPHQFSLIVNRCMKEYGTVLPCNGLTVSSLNETYIPLHEKNAVSYIGSRL